MQEEKEKRKEDKKKAEVELQSLFKPVIVQQTLAAGKCYLTSITKDQFSVFRSRSQIGFMHVFQTRIMYEGRKM